jgi:glycosyltransferase involved in cell wall biosynthesis
VSWRGGGVSIDLLDSGSVRSDPGDRPASAELPLVSVLLASRNGERFLPEALRGLRAQTYPRIELILVDDGSTDGTAAVFDALRGEHPDVRALRTESVGPAAARDAAFHASRGSLIAIHDGDDVSRPDRIERQVSFLADHPEVGVLGSVADRIDESGRRTGMLPVPLTGPSVRRVLRRAPPFVHGSVMMRRGVYVAAGGFRAAFRLSEDFDLWLRIPDGTGMANLPEPLYAWRAHGAGATARERGPMLFYAAAARAFADERRRTGSDSYELLARWPDPEAFLARYPDRTRLAFYLGELLAREGRAGEARRHLERAMGDRTMLRKAVPWWTLTWLLPFTSRGRRAARAGR